VKGSRRYANPASYLIEAEMARYLDELEALLADPEGPVRLDDEGDLHLRPLAAKKIDWTTQWYLREETAFR